MSSWVFGWGNDAPELQRDTVAGDTAATFSQAIDDRRDRVRHQFHSDTSDAPSRPAEHGCKEHFNFTTSISESKT
jgi:hypothetical protein